MHEEEALRLKGKDCGEKMGEGERKKTAKDFYEYLQSLSNYNPKVSWFGKSSSLHLTLLSVLAASFPPLLIMALREKSQTFFESFLLLTNLLVFFVISLVLFRTFVQSFSLYESMRCKHKFFL